MLTAGTIQEVIQILEHIIEESIQKNSRQGYFACLYRKMTIAVKDGIINGRFEDGIRMEKLDIHFANRYFAAYFNYAQNKTLTQSWRMAFDAAEQCYTAIQHLLLGMNAHINLDLGISAATISNGENIQLLQNDFNQINVIIGDLINAVQTDLEEICWPMKFIRCINNTHKDAVINFSMKMARDTAWANAVALSNIPDGGKDFYCSSLDSKIAIVAKNITTPKLSESLVLKAVQWFEPKTVGQIITALRD